VDILDTERQIITISGLEEQEPQRRQVLLEAGC
jgi:hypothetical protein